MVKAKDKKEKDNRGRRRLVFPVFKIVDDSQIVYQGICLTHNHVAKVIDNYSANVGMYINLELNKLGDYVVIEHELGENEFIDSKTSMMRAHDAAWKRFKRSKMNFTIDKMKNLSDTQVEEISKILNKGGDEAK